MLKLKSLKFIILKLKKKKERKKEERKKKGRRKSFFRSVAYKVLHISVAYKCCISCRRVLLISVASHMKNHSAKPLGFYRIGTFLNLCRGDHVPFFSPIWNLRIFFGIIEIYAYLVVTSKNITTLTPNPTHLE